MRYIFLHRIVHADSTQPKTYTKQGDSILMPSKKFEGQYLAAYNKFAEYFDSDETKYLLLSFQSSSHNFLHQRLTIG